ncbi:golgin subfamily A member 5 isoform X3 [Mirounga leonina]|uniref:golgin subfamily A member 5 isoform X3 n=1 Tax=Mirounga leonina TaxID=9715 RepID=UPI00156BF650|nr:golgin subfamily A member 5 isoform X3 [Mirounga leonina]
MSWFADLAGKAEDLLNRVDQGAATALSRKENSSNITYNKNADYPELQQNTDLTYQTGSKATYISSAADNIGNQKATILAGTANVKVGSRTSAEASHPVENASVPRPSSQFVRRKKSEPDDELLFDFLNSSQKEPTGRVEIKKERSKTPVLQSSRTAGVSSVNTSITAVKTIEENPSGSQSDVTSNNSDSGHEVQEDSSKENVSSSAACADHNPTPTHDGKSHELSNLRLENQLLRNEVQSLNQEMASLLQRSKETQEELTKARARVEKWNVDHSKSDRITRELRAQVDDLTAAVDAKDSQLAVLKVRLQEADQLLTTRTEALEALQTEKSRIMQDHSEGSSLQNQALQTLQERLHEADTARKREQESCKQMQSKEKLINSLKEGSGFEGLDSSTANSMELEELRHEKEMQKEEIQKLLGQIHQLRSELQDMEAQQVSEAESAREQLQDLQDQIAGQKASKQELEAELERQKQEFHYIEEDLYRTKNTLQSRIKDREEEIQKLRNQLTNKTLSNSSQSELENRLHQLTETLIQKQTMLESLSTEKNSLVFQLERLEQQVNSASGSSNNGSSINMSGVDNGEGTRLRNVPVLFNDTETNLAGMYGKVRKAASSIDQFSIRLGIFLRRYPIARVFVIIYMALLHLWVMIVLLTYTPEMHHDQPHGK